MLYWQFSIQLSREKKRNNFHRPDFSLCANLISMAKTDLEHKTFASTHRESQWAGCENLRACVTQRRRYAGKEKKRHTHALVSRTQLTYSLILRVYVYIRTTTHTLVRTFSEGESPLGLAAPRPSGQDGRRRGPTNYARAGSAPAHTIARLRAIRLNCCGGGSSAALFPREPASAFFGCCCCSSARFFSSSGLLLATSL